eukprot:scaffold388_cov244-Pinguiococcus_pyrenoidosus.AAC.29
MESRPLLGSYNFRQPADSSPQSFWRKYVWVGQDREPEVRHLGAKRQLLGAENGGKLEILPRDGYLFRRSTNERQQFARRTPRMLWGHGPEA